VILLVSHRTAYYQAGVSCKTTLLLYLSSFSSNKVRFQLTTFTCNRVVLFAVMLLFTLLLSFTLWYFHNLFSINIACDLRDNWYSCCKLNFYIFVEFMANKYILIWCGIEMSFVRMLSFGIHVSADVHNFANLKVLKIHFVIQWLD